uniref:Receptor-like serine/threonine-protein kinase n=1 Tax=Oryza punctata TaxID=4537 RepID=A0A0E0JFQ8_ORYPU
MNTAIKWRYLFSPSSVVLLPFLINFIHPDCKLTFARDTLLPGQSLNTNQTLMSENGAFELGFNCSVYSCCAIAIRFTNSSFCTYDYLPVWQHNLECICESSSISLSENGILQINEGYRTLSISNYTRTASRSAVAVLLDNGNLVVRDQVNSSMVFWQSFDNPTGVLISGGRLGFNSITGNNVSLSYPSIWDDTYSPDYTLITLTMDATRRRGFIIQRNPIGLAFSGTFPSWIDIHEDGDNALALNGMNAYIRLNSSGFIEFGKQDVCSSVLWSAPESLCDFDSYCGPYSLCTRSGSCICPVGFVSPYAGGWNGLGCSRMVPMNCERGVSTHPQTGFYPIDGVYRFPKNSWSSDARSLKECESSCIRDCTCLAFAYNTTCLLWFVELRNTVVLDSGSNGNRLYIRTATNQQQNSGSRASPQFSNQKKVIVLSIMGMLAGIAVVLIFLWRCQIKLLTAKLVYENEILMVFSFAQIKNSTKNFSEKLGEGGFGSVFKGAILGSMTVAVKKLKDLRQGEKQFRAEVQTVGMIQHNNLVRLLGFCADGSNRLLVYEYLTNGSLNSHLFRGNSAKLLSWELRYQIALGTARGLAYLHEECKDCIVHCDMKPDNILLDSEFCPKIADFGMAKLLGRDFSRALTTMRGTIGYLAPEWISGLPITHKADVYSYGMMLLEIISGRRNSEKIKEGKHTYFPIYAACKVNEGDVMCLLDRKLEGNADAEQLEKACRIACWCIQDAEDHRPMMGQVVHMLEGVMDVEVPPVPRSLQYFVGMEDNNTQSAECN